MKQTLSILLLAAVLATSCLQKTTDSKPKEQSFNIKELYATGDLPPTNEADRFVITGTIDETDLGGSFVVNTVDGDRVALTFKPEQMQVTDRKTFNAYLLKGNKVKCVGTKLDPGVYALLAAKITEQ
ncbi:hypothetical protein [Mucilaginibacter sp. HD30]